MLEQDISPVTCEVIQASIVAACNEMVTVVRQTGYNMMIWEAQDFSVGMADANGYLIGQNRGASPNFDVSLLVRHAVEDIGRERLYPGDVLIANHPLLSGQHLNNVALWQPVFYDDEMVGIIATRAHWMDIGGSKVGLGITKTRDLYQEGLIFKNIKAYERGKANETLFQILNDNLRRPDLAIGDMRGQIAACHIGEKRFISLMQKYGMTTVQRALAILADRAEERARRVVEQIPDGVYEFESFLDSDGINMDKTLPMKVKVIIEGSEMVIDYSGVADQVEGPMNSTYGAMNAARGLFKSLTSPTEPANDGCYRNLKWIVPPGKIISALPPAPMASWALPLSTLADTTYAALAPAIPDQVAAGHKADQGDYTIYGTDPVTRRLWFAANIRGGGWGGRPHEDGENETVSMRQANVMSAPVEVQEALNPILIERHELIQDSGGAGKNRGGLGSEWRIRTLGVDHAYCNISCERHKCPPWGLWGGKPGTPNHAYLDLGDGNGPELVLKRPGNYLPKEGWVAYRSAGGGGWGDPLEREPERVLVDVIREYVSVGKAATEYGVVIDLEKKQVVEAATAALREKMRRERRDSAAGEGGSQLPPPAL